MRTPPATTRRPVPALGALLCLLAGCVGEPPPFRPRPSADATPDRAAAGPDTGPDAGPDADTRPDAETDAAPDASPDAAPRPSACDLDDPDRGATWYVCDCLDGAAPGCVPGDDQSLGLTPERPWRTFAAVVRQFGLLEAGQTIALCRGGAFTMTLPGTWIDNVTCRAEAPCALVDYTPPDAPAALPRPIVQADEIAFSATAQATSGLVFRGLDVRSAASSQPAFLLCDVDAVRICDVHVEGFGAGIQLGCRADDIERDVTVERATLTRLQRTGVTGRAARLTIRDTAIHDAASQGIALLQCDDCLIENTLVTGATRVGLQVQSARDGLTVRNTALALGGGATGVDITLDDGALVLVSNAIQASAADFRCFDLTLPDAAHVIDHNLCHATGFGAQWHGDDALIRWQERTGHDAASTDADPRFVDAATGDLRATDAASPLVDAGHPTRSAPLALDGRPRGPRPDIGAHER